MKFRPQRGSLVDAMAEAVDVGGRSGLASHLGCAPGDLNASPYGGDDDRIGWKNVHIVTDRIGVVGFCEGPLT